MLEAAAQVHTRIHALLGGNELGDADPLPRMGRRLHPPLRPRRQLLGRAPRARRSRATRSPPSSSATSPTSAAMSASRLRRHRAARRWKRSSASACRSRSSCPAASTAPTPPGWTRSTRASPTSTRSSTPSPTTPTGTGTTRRRSAPAGPFGRIDDAAPADERTRRRRPSRSASPSTASRPPAAAASASARRPRPITCRRCSNAVVTRPDWKVEMLSVFQLRDRGTNSSDRELQFGLLRQDGTPEARLLDRPRGDAAVPRLSALCRRRPDMLEHRPIGVAGVQIRTAMRPGRRSLAAQALGRTTAGVAAAAH